MLDFLKICAQSTKRDVVEIFPKFIIGPSSDLMIRGRDFYAIWIEERGLWSTDEQDALRLIDRELDNYYKENKNKFEGRVVVKYMWDSDTGMIDKWHRYCQKQMRDNFQMLDEKLVFSNDETTKKDYASKKLNYPLEKGSISAYDKLMSVIYSPEERHKIEWAIGSVITGDSKLLQKFMVLYGAAGTGKSTILNIIQQLFEGYYSVFDARALGSSSNAFALEAFNTNPLVAIQHDGDLSRIEDNTRLNSLVSHELMTVNEKFKATYTSRFKCFLFMGTNKPVKITDAKSGLIRRLIDVSPTGDKLSPREYKTIMKQVGFELGHIAFHCKEVYLADPGKYDDYIPVSMFGATNDFYNFVLDAFYVFKNENGTTLKAAWEMYKTYCDEAKVPYPLSQRNFKEELKNYFYEFNERLNFDDGSRVRSYYSGFRIDKFEIPTQTTKKEEPKTKTLEFNDIKSIFDKKCADCPAQYATKNETPSKKWDDVTSKLSELDTSKLHYVKVPENHIVIDFDIPDKNGKKCFKLNLEEASKWPATYAELSKSGQGIHLHYIYTGDPTKLSRIYDDHIEVKVFTGGSALRRKLTKCNDLPIANISAGLPLKGDDKLVNFDAVNSEKALRTLIKRNLNKEYHSATKPSIDFIYKILEDAYNGELGYDVSDMYNDVLAFAANSTNQASYCIKLVSKMKFKSDDPSPPGKDESTDDFVFYDVEVFPNLFLVNWKFAGEGKPVVRMINPGPTDIEGLLRFKLIGFNCRRYDNHILYARLMGYTNEQLFHQSQRIIDGDKNAFFGEAYNISYTDVYDFAATKQSLKKWEIELGIHHKELGLPWDQPVPEERWVEVAEYCDNDVIATEAVFNHLKADFVARKILADLAGGNVNDTTNSLTTKIIFGNNRKPQSEFMYRDLSKPVHELPPDVLAFLKDACPEMMEQPHGKAKSLLPYFDGYKYEAGKSSYRDVDDLGEGGCVIGNPGMYVDVALLDIASMHPHSGIAEVLFGPRFTKAFKEIVDGRVNIKHEAWDTVSQMLDGKLKPYIQMVINGELTSADLAYALKIAINSVYGLTAANFENPFRDPRNKDNIVAKRGALFMVDLKHEVEKRGFTVVHIKTDSIKIANATPEIIQFVMDFGKRYGYTFEHEATYDRICLVNKAVYIARYKDGKHAGEWTATGTQFQIPYVFKKLFSKEPIEFADMCETKSVTTAIHLDMNEGMPDASELEKKIALLEREYDKRNKLGESGFDMGVLVAKIADLRMQMRSDEFHDYRFVGKVGSFCPIKEGCGGGILVRAGKDKDGNVKYDSVTGTLKPDKTPYRWLESEFVKTMGKEDIIDRSYYDKLVDDAVETISQYGDFEWFVSDDKPESIELETPPWKVACGKDTCEGCPHFTNDAYHMDCRLGYDIGDMIKLNEDKLKLKEK